MKDGTRTPTLVLRWFEPQDQDGSRENEKLITTLRKAQFWVDRKGCASAILPWCEKRCCALINYKAFLDAKVLKDYCRPPCTC